MNEAFIHAVRGYFPGHYFLSPSLPLVVFHGPQKGELLFMDWVKGSQRKLAEGYRRHPLLFPSLPGFTALVDPSPAACRGNSTKLLCRNGVERISLRFSFRNHPDRALRGNSLPRLPRQKAYQPPRFATGNLLQGLVFGLLHGAMFFLVTTPLKALIITLITGFSGWLLGWMAEKAAGGSILPGWMVHGVGNLLLSMAEAFGLL